ncbi:MAG TPA: lactate utilization protein [Clostridiales bacterium]|nr:lactate utilization protein [Clostridiales bacterium]
MELEELAKKMRLNEYEVDVVNSKEEAKEIILNMCSNKVVGIGDSHTISELNVIDELKQNTKELYAMQIDKSRENKLKSLIVDVFLLSANALSYDTGEMVNIDMVGNRVAPSLYGPEQVVFVIGKNKIVKDLSSAIDRVKNFVAPINAKAHNFSTPCTITGKCENCSHEKRICRTIVIYQKRPKKTPTRIILVNEELGW